MSQTRLGSALESITNLVVGLSINWLANIVLLRTIGFDVTVSQALHLSLIFTAISLVRSYALRRVFNRIRRLHRSTP